MINLDPYWYAPDFDENIGLAAMLLDDTLILNSFWWEKEWPKKAQNAFAIAVNTNDVFCYGADAVSVDYSELQDLYDHWKKDPYWGSLIWAAKKLNLMPLKRHIKAIQSKGWNLDAMGLQPNPADPA